MQVFGTFVVLSLAILIIFALGWITNKIGKFDKTGTPILGLGLITSIVLFAIFHIIYWIFGP